MGLSALQRGGNGPGAHLLSKGTVIALEHRVPSGSLCSRIALNLPHLGVLGSEPV